MIPHKRGYYMSAEQKLIDIMFECVLTRHDPSFRKSFDALSQEEMAAWITKQLASCGFETTPVGCSWGVLNTKNVHTNQRGFNDV